MRWMPGGRCVYFQRRHVGTVSIGVYFEERHGNFDAVLGVVCGVILVCWIVISPFVHANLAIVFGTLLIFLVGFLSANLLNKRRCK